MAPGTFLSCRVGEEVPDLLPTAFNSRHALGMAIPGEDLFVCVVKEDCWCSLRCRDVLNVFHAAEGSEQE